MTVKELLQKLLDLPVPVDKATVVFQDGKLCVLTSSGEDGETTVYVIQ